MIFTILLDEMNSDNRMDSTWLSPWGWLVFLLRRLLGELVAARLKARRITDINQTSSQETAEANQLPVFFGLEIPN